MHKLATLIRIISVSLLLASCGITPTSQEKNKAELDKIKGPEVGSIEASLKSQAENAANAGEFKRSSEMYRQLVDRVPNNPDYLAALAETFRRSGECDNALQAAAQSLLIKSTNVVALENKGLCLMEQGDFINAGKALEASLKEDKKRWRTLNGIAIIFALKGRYEDSLAYYNAALEIVPNSPSILNNKAMTLAMDKEFDKSLQTFEQARGYAKNNAYQIKQIDLNVALVYAIQGKLDEAEQTASPHLSKEGLYNNMGFYAYLANNTELAKTYLNKALIQSPVYYERAWNNLGALTSETGGDLPKNSGKNLDDDAPPKKKQAAPIGVQLNDIPTSKPTGMQPSGE